MQLAVRDALIAFMAATAQAQAEATKAAQRAGIEHAKLHGDRAYLGVSRVGRALSSTMCEPCWARRLWELRDRSRDRADPADGYRIRMIGF